jgi:hypothetical protein
VSRGDRTKRKGSRHVRAAAYAFGGATTEARHSLTALRDKYPELTLAQVSEDFPPLPPAYCARVVETLHGLGLPS